MLPFLFASALLASCTALPPTTTHEPAPRPAPPGSVAASMIGTWTLTDSATGDIGELTLSATGLTGTMPCGTIDGVWVTAGDAWLGEMSLSDPGCVRDGALDAPWLTSTAGVEATDAGWHLLAPDGGITATLTEGTPGGTAAGTPDADVIYSAQPLPVDLSTGAIAGRWLVTEAAESALGAADPTAITRYPTFVEFTERTWEISGGCFGSGRWEDLGDGYVVAMGPGVMVGLGCGGPYVAPLITAMRTAGFDGDELVLFDRSGDELLRLVRG